MKRQLLTSFALCFIGVAAPADAVIFTYTGTNVGSPTYNRAFADFSGLSGVGTNVAYDLLSFSVDTTGDYTFLETADYDSFLFLYEGAFDPLDATANGIAANDDLLGLTTSGFAASLSAGTSYFAVLTAFANGDAGLHSLTIGGDGTVTPVTGVVPEPTSWAMLIIGFGTLGVALRGRRHRLAGPTMV